MKKIILGILVLLAVAAAVVYSLQLIPKKPAVVEAPVTSPATPRLINELGYACQNGKTIQAKFFETDAAPTQNPDGSPVPTGSVQLELSDGRSLDVPQSLSADGARYATANDAFVFWEKGNGVTIYENDAEKDFIGCVLVSPESATAPLPAVYVDTAAQFSVRLPSLASTTADGFVALSTYTVDTASGTTAGGVKFTIPAAMATGTNLAVGSYLSVEKLDVPECTATAFGDNLGTSTLLTDVTGTNYSLASTTDAGAGNRYEETIYALPGTKPCIAVRYFLHYSVLENYASGTVTAFDRKGLMTIFDQIRQSLVVNL